MDFLKNFNVLRVLNLTVARINAIVVQICLEELFLENLQIMVDQKSKDIGQMELRCIASRRKRSSDPKHEAFLRLLEPRERYDN